jgi:hypothetical protein
MTSFHCSPSRPFGIHPAVRNDEDCPRCGWIAPGPKGDARRDAAILAEHGWTVIEGGVRGAPVPAARAA